ncbi:hypothetical protein C8Q80DRAFT_680947 [Daedaleopsis nitida]|nr:hypothetical protein C8Q80DRAFT_680947 [Daedaleopsis nitida]
MLDTKGSAARWEVELQLREQFGERRVKIQKQTIYRYSRRTTGSSIANRLTAEDNTNHETKEEESYGS